MKKITAALCLFFFSQAVTGQTNSNLNSYAEEVFYSENNQLSFIRFKESHRVNESEVAEFINMMVFPGGKTSVSLLKSEKDELGFTHSKFKVLQNGILFADKVIMAHSREGKLISLNGDLYEPQIAANGFSISEENALNFALAKVGAKKYKWQNKEEEQHMRQALNQPDFSYLPIATKVVYEKDGKVRSAYRFNIYAEQPLYRANVFVDATTGKILDEQNLICTTDVPATALTKFSGTQSMTCDQNGSIYRLRETQRGLGIDTYNMQNTTTYSSTDFTNTSSSWTSTGFDQAATDAHWGAEKTYDYYWTQHSRNSVNNNGYKLLSYVHYMVGYTNAFWDGQRMTYGDGNGGSLKIFTTLDICGHEITHGVTGNSAGLNYSNESGALNESFSDIFGTCIENYGRPGNWNWKIGEDMTNSGNGLRNMSNPNLFGDPDTYMGTNYYTGTADNGGVHTNSGVSNYWFYLLTMGGSGTNDLSNAYSVSGLGITAASKIAYRALTVYFTATTNFTNARNLTIQAAKDIYGVCSNEMIQTTRAWYAVGVGANYVNGFIGTNFTSTGSSFCSAPAAVNFNNTTANALSYAWDFGDGATSTATNASHTYTAPGVYTVKLKSLGCGNLQDSIVKTSYIVVNTTPASPLTMGGDACLGNPVTLSAGGSGGQILWYTSASGGSPIGSGNTFVTPAINNTAIYYAASALTVAPVFGGIPSNTGGGFLTNNAQWLVFDVLQGGVLNSVVVYAQSSGNRTIQLRNSGNVIVSSTTASLSVGANTVILNYNLSPGTNYQLGLSSTSSSSLYRSNSGVSYPYNIGGCVNITGSSAGAANYYWFYNWQVTKNPCESPRVAATAVINPIPVVNMSASNTLVCVSDGVSLSGAPAGGVFGGSGVTGSMFNASLLGPGTYTVTYDYSDINGCTNRASSTLQAELCTGIAKTVVAENVLIYPNPAKENLFIKNASAEGQSKVEIADASGRIISSVVILSNEQALDLTDLSNGLYILSLKDKTGKTVKTVKLVKE
jgi:bacillolysin